MTSAFGRSHWDLIALTKSAKTRPAIPNKNVHEAAWCSASKHDYNHPKDFHAAPSITVSLTRSPFKIGYLESIADFLRKVNAIVINAERFRHPERHLDQKRSRCGPQHCSRFRTDWHRMALKSDVALPCIAFVIKHARLVVFGKANTNC
jgi:hypothetical protein